MFRAAVNNGKPQGPHRRAAALTHLRLCLPSVSPAFVVLEELLVVVVEEEVEVEEAGVGTGSCSFFSVAS